MAPPELPTDPGKTRDDDDATAWFNGIDAVSGGPLTPRLDVAALARLARGQPMDAAALADLRAAAPAEATWGLESGFDATLLSDTGWALVLPADAGDRGQALLDALAPLLDLRREQAGARFRIYAGVEGVRPGDTARGWLARAPRSKSAGPVTPDKVPFYLLLAGSPETLPFRFQYELGVNYAVGRLPFDDPASAARYAAGVVRAERGQASATRRAAFFGVRNDGDVATRMSAEQLVRPLVDESVSKAAGRWEVDALMAGDATKAALRSRLLDAAPPALLFTASHGMGFPDGHPLQAAHQGALLCQDWPGPLRHHGPIPPAFWFGGDDVPEDADLSGLVAFHFACYGAGTPRFDDYLRTGEGRLSIAPAPFLAALPRRVLGLAQGSALAVVGHVERAWSYSFAAPGVGPDIAAHASAVRSLLAGEPVGLAMQGFGLRHADLAVAIAGELEDERDGAHVEDAELARLWTAHNDARSFVVLGDPAVRLA